MRKITTIKLNNQEEHIYSYEMYIFDEEEDGYDFHIEVVISEIVAEKYYEASEIDVTIIYENNEEKQLSMKVFDITQVGNAEVPILHLCKESINIDEYRDLRVFNVDNYEVRDIKSDLTIEDIRKVEMPLSEVYTTLILPIDQTEWIDWTGEGINEMLSEAIYDYWKKKNIKR